jgi:D-alanine-D-alanine ligase-like ATP-grasp enzyme
LTRLIDRLGGAGRVGRELAVRLDIVRSTGLPHVWRRRRDEARVAALPDPGDTYGALWRDAAGQLGADVIELGGEFLEIRRGRAWTRVRNNLTMLDDGATLRLALQKPIVHRLLSGHGLPVPESLEFAASDLPGALAFLSSGPAPCVVKPVSGGGGYSVTSGIRTEADLMRARLRAARVDRRLLIERQVEGEFYRLLFLGGELLDVIRRRPPRVTGDGRSTVEQLIAAENERRVARRHQALLWPLRVDLECILTLQAQGLRLSSVLPAGQTVPVKTVISQNTIGDNETVRGDIAAELVEQGRLAAEVVGLRLAGIDVITRDLQRDPASSGGVILEVNGTPGLNYHYEVADSEHATRVAIPILDALLADSDRHRTRVRQS